MPDIRPTGGVALAREWTSDLVEIRCSGMDLDGILLHAERMEDFAGMLVAALRLDLPTVCAPPAAIPSLSASLVGLGLAPGMEDPASTAVSLAEKDGLHPHGLVDNFSLANALRSGIAAGGGPELLVHLAALAREARVAGFDQMIRVLVSETPEVPPEWLRQHGTTGLLSSLGDSLHDIPTVAGTLEESLPSAPPPPDEYARLVFVMARSSGAEAICRVRAGVDEATGECRVFGSEEEAISALRRDEVGQGAMVVVGGCGPRGGPGLSKLGGLGLALQEEGLDVPVLTDGLAPAGATGPWISLFTPEASEDSVLGLLRNDDTLRMDLTEGRIRTGIGVWEIEIREPTEVPNRADTAYAARYASTALPALEGAGFD
jgi:dihydroxy-acid dehydratase